LEARWAPVVWGLLDRAFALAHENTMAIVEALSFQQFGLVSTGPRWVAAIGLGAFIQPTVSLSDYRGLIPIIGTIV
jgi:hypothetical protein